MKERPILFSGPMVRALLDGSKTQTRRELKVRGWQAAMLRTLEFVHVLHGAAARVLSCAQPVDTAWAGFKLSADSTSPAYFKCPYGQPGDRLWVRETWGVVSNAWDEDGNLIDWVPDRPAAAIHEMPFGQGYYSGHVIYAADGPHEWAGDDDGGGEPRSAWHPSIHMPRAASRIRLEIVSVRVERLQDISEADARAEGIVDGGCTNCGNSSHPAPCGCGNPAPDWADGFFGLWESINGSESLIANPWVWVVEFKRITPAPNGAAANPASVLREKDGGAK